MDCKISVIIPVYNVEKYIGRCIKSILCQEYENLEIIIVDNNSTDHTAQVVEEYHIKDDRVVYLSCKEPGVCNARNMGIDNVHGEWFAFIDADDWIEPSFFSTLIRNAIQNDCSISACCYINDDGSNKKGMSENIVLNFDDSEACIHNFICDAPSMEGMVWNKIYKTQEYKNVRFNTLIRVNEDCEYTFEIMKRCERACLTKAQLYHWYNREDSACRKKPQAIELHNANVFLHLLENTSYLNDDEIEIKLKVEYVRIILNMFMYVKYRYDTEDMVSVKQRLIEWKEDVLPNLNRNSQKYYDTIIYNPSLMDVIRWKNNFISVLKRRIKGLIKYTE